MKTWDLITRRRFMEGTVGAVTIAALPAPQTKRPPRSARVVIVRDQQALNEAHDVNAAVLDRMLADTVMKVTGKGTAKDAWLSLVKPTDTVGLVPTPHLNPTHRELVEAVRKALVAAGVPADEDRRGAGGHREAARLHGADRHARAQGALADRPGRGDEALHHVLRAARLVSRPEQREPGRDLAAARREGQDEAGPARRAPPAVRQGAAARPALHVGLQGPHRRPPTRWPSTRSASRSSWRSGRRFAANRGRSRRRRSAWPPRTRGSASAPAGWRRSRSRSSAGPRRC